ncbi:MULTISPECIES: hypothetical protein [Chryseobacterium]|uniref:hypothetical protein n=1 Tax=Chryseobacterium TaxID=59732 RepID=UPI00195E1AD4|nr:MULTISPECIES: hypothetical protein [Chryseobacterium]MBM7421073.1 hypothetical protein [Chryseobacterium sp. JUb44]MDH6211030.1 hypothetical protein [Chryseobacterium sp. BIGb0186]WSO09696.1 hypothetical protein VUJ64_17905 [Chryseobacterium scophthalmum]
MGDLAKKRDVRLINKVLAHETGHLIANILLNSVQPEPKVDKIIISWSKEHKKPWGRIEYTVKEGPDSWELPKDIDLCCTTILSLYSGCIWETFFDSIYHKSQLSLSNIGGCYETSGLSDIQTIGCINNKFLKRRLNQEFTENSIKIPYIDILNSLSDEKKKDIYDFFENISKKIEIGLFDGNNPMDYQLSSEQLEELSAFINSEFIEPYKKELLDILSKIRGIVPSID